MSHLHDATVRAPALPKSCARCQQKKKKCDGVPCKNCTQAGIQCVQAAPVLRRQRFPERALLEKIRYYEALLLQNGIEFRPLHASSGTAATRHFNKNTTGSNDEDTSIGSSSLGNYDFNGETTQNSEIASTGWKSKIASEEAKEFWDLMGKLTLSDEEYEIGASSKDYPRSPPSSERDGGNANVFDEIFRKKDGGLVFSLQHPDKPLVELHPSPGQIFKLWQTYLENVDPLLKVTHTPTLQPRIIDAISNLSGCAPTFVALMFSIYCSATSSLQDEDCEALLQMDKKRALSSFHSACQQALREADFLRTDSMDCLIALYLYLTSIQSQADPRSVASLVSVALKIGHRFGLSRESDNLRFGPLEGELRRRLWWSLSIFDQRICEFTDYNSTSLTPIWSCRPPRNISDGDIHAEMSSPPPVHQMPTEAIFVVVRSEICDVLRRSAYHLDFVDPALKEFTNTRSSAPPISMAELEKVIEEKYLTNCNLENPLHFMTAWMMRGEIAKNCILEHYSRHWGSVNQPSDADRDLRVSLASRMLDCDSKLVANLIGFRWMLEFYLPVPAYFYLFSELRARPLRTDALKIWTIIDCNYQVHRMDKMESPFLSMLGRKAIPAWEARAAAIAFAEEDRTPHIVADLRLKLASNPKKFYATDMPSLDTMMTTDFSDFSMLGWPMGSGEGYDAGDQMFPSLDPWLYDQPN